MLYLFYILQYWIQFAKVGILLETAVDPDPATVSDVEMSKSISTSRGTTIECEGNEHSVRAVDCAFVRSALSSVYVLLPATESMDRRCAEAEVWSSCTKGANEAKFDGCPSISAGGNSDDEKEDLAAENDKSLSSTFSALAFAGTVETPLEGRIATVAVAIGARTHGGRLRGNEEDKGDDAFRS